MKNLWQQQKILEKGNAPTASEQAGYSPHIYNDTVKHNPRKIGRHNVRKALSMAGMGGISARKEGIVAGNWIAEATSKHKGAFSSAAQKHHMGTAAYAKKEAHAPGVLGKRARLAQTLMGMRHHAEGCVSEPSGDGPSGPHKGFMMILMPHHGQPPMQHHAFGSVAAPSMPTPMPSPMGAYGQQQVRRVPHPATKRVVPQQFRAPLPTTGGARSPIATRPVMSQRLPHHATGNVAAPPQQVPYGAYGSMVSQGPPVVGGAPGSRLQMGGSIYG
jgi:hypothetical protein